MKQFLKILKIFVGLLLSAAIGYGGARLIIWLAGGVSDTTQHHSEGVDYGLLALSCGLSFLWLFVTSVIHLLMHEAGHLIMGLLTGFQFLSFRIFKFTLVKTNEGLQWKRFHIAGTGGQCLMELPLHQDPKTAPWFWYNAGGVLMNLLLAVLAIIMLRSFHWGIFGLTFFILLAFVGVIMALMNGIPMTIGGVGNDGHNLWLLWKHPENRRYFVHSLQMAGQTSRGMRMKEMPAEWFVDIPVTAQSSILEISNRATYMNYLEDQIKLDEARQVAEELMSLGKKLPQLFKMEVGGERVMLELMTTNRQEVIEELWDKQLARYTEKNSKYSPLKYAVLYCHELLYNHDAEKAETYKHQLIEHQNEYTMPGETRLALHLIEIAEKNK